MEFSRIFRRFLVLFWLGAVVFPLSAGLFHSLGLIFSFGGDLPGGTFLRVLAQVFFWGWIADLTVLTLLLVSEKIFRAM